MKNDIFQVDEKIKILSDSMTKIGEYASTIDSALKIKREEI